MHSAYKNLAYKGHPHIWIKTFWPKPFLYKSVEKTPLIRIKIPLIRIRALDFSSKVGSFHVFEKNLRWFEIAKPRGEGSGVPHQDVGKNRIDDVYGFPCILRSSKASCQCKIVLHDALNVLYFCDGFCLTNSIPKRNIGYKGPPLIRVKTGLPNVILISGVHCRSWDTLYYYYPR